MKKSIFLKIAIAFIILIGISTILVNVLILSGKTKAFVVSKLEQALGKKLEIETLRYTPLSTFSLKNVTVYRDLDSTKPLIKIESLKFNPSLLPLLIQKKLIVKLDIRNLSARGFNLNGSVQTSLVSDPSGISKFTGKVRLIDFLLETKSIPSPISRFNSLITLEKDSIQISNAYCYFKDAKYQLSGYFEDIVEPKMDFSLKSEKFDSNAKLALNDDYIQIEALNAQLGDSFIELIGDISNLASPVFNLYGKSRINIKDFNQFFAEKNLDPKLNGICDAELFLKGNTDQLQNLEFGLKAKSPKLSMHGFDLDDFYVDFRMKNGLINTPKLLAGFYGGYISGSVTMEPFSNDRPYSIDMSLQNADLAIWAKRTGFDKKISGVLSSRFSLNGYYNDIASLSGKGWLSITNGYLWEAPVLGGVASILSMPGLKSIVFREAAGNFSIGRQKLKITDLVFYSDNANISVKGNIGFDTRLDLLVTTNITKDLIEDSSEAATIANILIQQAGQFLGRVKITGTLNNPVYKVKPGGGSSSGMKSVEKPIQKIFKKEIGDLLKDILE